MLFLIALSGLLAYGSWRFLEIPFRAKSQSWIGDRTFYLSACGVVSAAFILFGLYVIKTGGIPGRFTPEEVKIAEGINDHGKYSVCVGAFANDAMLKGPCRLGIPKASLDFVVFGDSQAAAIADGISLAAERNNQAGVIYSVPSCPPLLGIGGDWAPSLRDCRQLQANMVEIAKKLGVRTVILHARWEILDDKYFIKSQKSNPDTALNVFQEPLIKTLEAFQQLGMKVVIISGTPSADFAVPTALARWKKLRPSLDLRPEMSKFLEKNRTSFKLFKMPIVQKYADIVDVYEWFCREGEKGRCELAEDIHPYFTDSTHLSLYASRALGGELNRVFAQAEPTQSHNNYQNSSRP
jgi:hypothetical protein